MLPHDAYFIDLNIPYEILTANIWYLFKLCLVSYFLFYWLPSKVFPQEHMKNKIEKVVFNFIYMIAYIELVVTFLIFTKIFSLLFFILVLLMTKVLFLKFYYKKDIFVLINNLRIKIMLGMLNILDNPKAFKEDIFRAFKTKLILAQHTITLYSISKNSIFYTIFIYIFFILIARGLLSYSDPLPDTAQFMEWVSSLQNNILFADNKTFGADFYGISILIFIVNVFSNIDQIILFSLYPLLLLFALYSTIYYIIKDFSDSKYIALFGVMIHGLIFMSPLSNLILGEVVVTSNPDIFNLYGLKFYIPNKEDISLYGNFIGYTPYIRYISGMAYEHASVFVFLNAYFLIKTFETQYNKYLILYSLSLMLVFTFHGGGAISLMLMSIFITVNALLFRKINLRLLKKGGLAIIVASILGNLWILSMIKYGIPQDFGAAAPMLDKIFHTRNSVATVQNGGFETLRIVNLSFTHLVMFLSLFFAILIALFTKNRFINTSLLLAVFAIFITYFGPNAGTPLFAKQSRLADYLFFAITILSSYYLLFFVYKPLRHIFKKSIKSLMLVLIFIIFILLILSQPKWIETQKFWKNINQTQYTSIPNILLKINHENRPFSWTVIAYIQTYAKIKNKGYHINTQNFLLQYDPSEYYLKIPTQKIFIVVENRPNAYQGMGEWFYRWRPEIQEHLKSWVAIYKMNHTNLILYKKTRTVSVYEIDNTKYLQYLQDLKKKENK